MASEGETFLFGMFVGSLLVGMLACLASSNLWRAEAIERGVARYHPTTGQWEWTVKRIVEEKGK